MTTTRRAATSAFPSDCWYALARSGDAKVRSAPSLGEAGGAWRMYGSDDRARAPARW